MEMKRGDIVLCVIAGDYGKPRPALVIQSDLFNEVHPSLKLLPITSHLIDTPLFRIPLKASKTTGLKDTWDQTSPTRLLPSRIERVL
jgi:mRNA interferase MazF